MKAILLRSTLALALSCGVLAGAAATTVYREVEGGNLDFYYDVQLYPNAHAVALGDSLMLDSSRYMTDLNRISPMVIAVAHSGHVLTGGSSTQVRGYYLVTTGNSVLRTQIFSSAQGGTFEYGAFTPTTFYFNAGQSFDLQSLRDSPSAGFWQGRASDQSDRGDFSAVGLFAHYLVNASDPDVRSGGEAVLTNVIFSFNQEALQAPPLPVPEPQTYAMLLAGLGLVGATARRRSSRILKEKQQ
ncbi:MULTISPECIES: PEPxxWA-CTERM sorting domain-containing protein [unclassified Duganella]|uniref:PEPxxWA-CTERM sorting domain-containing protein n=1 Tax=unclassified Duganella TaxID=2636909 RepID=UPI001E3E17C7|nr:MULTISPECIES: PEPxxWA-CTERM sorting domain-containing protein [unclassified Duganella]